MTFGLPTTRIEVNDGSCVVVAWCDCNCADADLWTPWWAPVWLSGPGGAREAILRTLEAMATEPYFAVHANGRHCLARLIPRAAR